MKRKFTFLIAAALMLLTMMVQPITALGQTPTEVTFTFSDHYTSNTVLDDNAIAIDNVISATFHKRSGGTATQYYTNGNAVRWYGGGTLDFVATNATITEISITFTQTANSISANTGTYSNGTWSGSASSLTLTQSGTSGHCRISAITVTYSSSGGGPTEDNDLALTDTPVELTFDLYNNSSAQVINYTTSSTGTVSIADNQYIYTEIDEENKTITVTPVKVTPSEQTITVNQAADDTYYAGSTTFSVNITDSTPFAGGDVTFTAGTDMGTTTANNSPDEMTKSGVTISSTDAAFATAQYRIYSGSTTTISVNNNNVITSIVFTKNGSYDLSKLSTTTGSYNSSTGTWTGNAASIVFSASAQVRLDKIVVTVEAPTTDPSINASDVNIAYNAQGGNIEFTIVNPDDDATLEAEVVEGATISNFTLGTVGESTIAFTCDANTETTARTATVTLNYVKNTEVLATKDVTITQDASPTIYTSFEALLAAAPTTATNVYINFQNWVITGANNSQHAFLSDGTNGCIIYGSDLGFTAGDILSGTVQCKFQKYNESLELTNLTSASEGLTVTTGGTVTIAEIAMADLQAVNTGALVHYENLLCDARTEGNYTNYYLIDANNNEIQVYKTLLEDYANYLEDGKTYNITGVFVLNNTTKRVNPRSADDIEEVIVVTPVISAENVEITYDATSGTITYEIENYVAGNMTASTEATWISDFTYQQFDEIGEVGFTTTENDGVARQATVTLTYTYNTNQTVTKNVTVSQAAAPVPSITVDPETITWNNSPINVELSQTITVSQANLTDDIEITTTIGAVDPTSIEAGAEATEITFTHTPTTAGDFEGTITLTSGTTVKEITVSGSAVEPSGESWVKVESADDLEVDGVYVIAATIHDDHVYNKVAGNISGQLLSCHTATFSANHDEITELPDEAIRFTLSGEEGAWTFANEDGDLLGSTAAKKMAWNNGTTTWDLSFEGNFVMANTTTSYGTLQYNYNGGSDRFTTYTSGQTPIQLYKLTSSNPRIVAQDVDLESSETEGTISYEVKNSVEGGELTASVPANSWITLGEVGDESIPFTCEANTGDERTETVTLTYTYNTNETVTKDITVTQAAYIAPVYGITIFTVLPQHVEVDVKDAQGENINTATEGTIVYLTAIPDECWEFTGWLVVNTTPDPSELVTVTDDHFTMPAGEVTVQALIEEKTLYTINYNSNGVTTSEQVCENPIAAEDLLTPDNVPAGFSFAGWTSDKATTDIVTSVTLSDEPTTLYAVFSIEEGSIPGDFTLVTEELDDWSGDYLIAYDDNTFANGQNGGTTGIGAASSSVDPGTNLSNNIVNGSWGCNYYITLEKVDANSSTYLLKTQDGYYNYQTSNNNGIATSINRETAANCPLSVSLGDDGNIEISVSGTMFSYNSGNGGFFRFYKNNGANQNKVYAYKRGTDTPGTLAYYINVFQNETVEGDIIIDSKTVIPSGVILDMNGYNINNTEPANLVIEDGGQLIVNNSVAATVEKTIQASGSWGSKDGGVDGWDLISSPIGTVNTADVTNLTPAPVGTALQYDLYSYNEATKTWYNQQGTEHPFTQLMVGEGYLYSRKENADLGFAGEVSSASITKALTYTETNGTLAGWNLVGNPYTHNITWANLEPTNVVTTGYYTLGYDGQWSAEPSTTTVIKPMQGFLVKANALDANIVFNNTASSKSRANDDYIKFIVANSQYEDAAYAMFSENVGLDKINHRNADIPMVYIPQNDKNYAIATMDDNTQAFNLNFKAMTTGQYTLSFKAQGSYSYLHVIDRITGEDIDMLLDGEYTFIGSPRDNENRFIVKLNYNANIDELEAGDSFAYQYGNDIIVNGKGELQVFDVNGRMVMNTVINGKQTVNIPTTGLYIFRMVGESVKTQKIVVR